MSTAPGTFQPALRWILAEYCLEHDERQVAALLAGVSLESLKDLKPLPKRFSLFPNPGLAWKFVDISIGCLKKLVNLPFEDVLDLAKYGFDQ
jgi:hypothetical protein